jgi:uncharacterized protein YndB with AHSA1/START domain/uncharacterized protein YciI
MNADRPAGADQAGAGQAGPSKPAVIAPVRHEIVVNAPIERAFRVFTDGFGRWWPKTHTIASFPVDRAIIEPWVGGRCFDRGADGRECDWGQVLAWEPPARLVLAWQVDGTWSYEPEVVNASRVTISFAALGGQTRVTVVHDEFERHLNAGPDLADGVRDGWGTALRLFADAAEPDSAAAPAAQAAPADPPPCKYVLSYESVPDFRPLARQHYPAHYARLMTFHERGDLLMVGMLLEPANGDAMGVFASREAAEEFVAEDPFILNKVVASWSIRPWQEIFHHRGTDAGDR